MNDSRNCTCHPSERPEPCQHKYAFSECVRTNISGEPLPDNWSERDSHDTFYEYLKIVREEQLAGKPLPSMFQREGE